MRIVAGDGVGLRNESTECALRTTRKHGGDACAQALTPKNRQEIAPPFVAGTGGEPTILPNEFLVQLISLAPLPAAALLCMQGAGPLANDPGWSENPACSRRIGHCNAFLRGAFLCVF